MSSPIQDADLVYALVVGIGEYSRWPGFDRPGLDDDAVEFARWLRRCGVPPQNIKLLLSPRRTDLPDDLQCGASPSGADPIRDALTDLCSSVGEVLWVFWAGHGYLTGTEMRLLGAGASPKRATNISFDELIVACSDKNVQGFQRQVFIVDACRLAAAGVTEADRLVPWDQPLGSRAIEQTVIYACAPGMAAPFSTEQRGGLFSKTVLAELNRRDNSFAINPDCTSLAKAVIRQAKAVTRRGEGDGRVLAPTWLLWRNTLETTKSGREWNVVEVGATDSKPAKAYELRAFAISGDEIGARNETWGSVSECRLDVAWCLDRTQVRAILADYADADLCGELNLVEQQILTTIAEMSPIREWRHIDANMPCPADMTDFLECDSIPAVVLRVECSAPAHRDQQPNQSVSRWVNSLEQTVPGIDIVVQVASEYPVDSLLTVGQTARSLKARAGARWPVFVRNRPGSAATQAMLATSGQGATIATVLQQLHREADLRGLDRAIWYPDALSGGGSSSVNHIPGADIAEAVIQSAEEVETPDAALEAGLLCAIRDLTPHWYLPLLRAYAGRNHGPVWTAAAAVAAVYDDDLDVWLKAAGGSVGPEQLAGPLESWLCDAMSLAHLRLGDIATAELWSGQDASRGVMELCSWVRDHPHQNLFIADFERLDWTAWVLAPRALLSVDLNPLSAPSQVWRSKEFWAAIAAHPVSPTTLHALRAIPAHLRVLWATVGKPVEHQESVLVEDITRCRRVLRYVAMRERDTA
ncbi:MULTISPECIES: caspase family protein [Actinomycetes]|uniref:caspase family protein n=1 Tax=Actinomycetes TaxID=1760 RepID=UPI0004C21447|nr:MULTISPECIES: caspase family protein [Actinomycetes]